MKKLIYILTCFMLFTACSSLVDDLSEDPNNPTNATYQYILTGAEVGNIILQTGETARRAGIFSGYYTGIDRQHLGFSEYTVTTSDFDDLWEDAFSKVIRNSIEAEKAAISEGIEGVTIGITQTVRAMAFGTTTSLYGDIPFDEAGTVESENPAYEDQSVVYNKIQVLLDDAITNLQLGTGRPAAGSDIYFDGDPTAWLEVAYTLKARYYMHTKDYASAYSAAQNGISSNGNTLKAPHGTAADAANLNYQFFAIQVRQSDLITSEFMTSLIDSDAGTNPIIANYRGNAKTDETARYNYLFHTSDFGVQPNIGTDGFAEIDASAALVTYEENLLILAEAGARTVDFATGLGHLNDFRSFMSNGGYLTNPTLSDAQYDAYISTDFDNGGIENMDGVSSDNALLREILEERYITFFGQVEGFNDMRRTMDETIVRVSVPINTGTALPERFLYPQSEIDRNTSTPNPIPNFFDPTEVNQ